MNLEQRRYDQILSAYTLLVTATVLIAIVTCSHANNTTYNITAFTQKYQKQIDSLRCKTFSLVVTTSEGVPVKNTKIRIIQKRHVFKFGAALSPVLFEFSTMRKAKLKVLSHATKMFNTVVDGSGFKWNTIEKKRGNIADGVENHKRFLDWALQNNFTIRHHCLFWANPDNNPPWVHTLDSASLKKAIDQRIIMVKRYFGQYITELDVINEMMYYDFYSTRAGEQIVKYIFQTTQKAFPQCVLYLNDNPFLKEKSFNAFNNYANHIQACKKKNIPFGGIGLQAHYDLNYVVSKAKIDPLYFIQKIDEGISLLSKAAGLPILISEYDCAVKDEKIRADFLEAFYSMAFAHPDVEGIIFWGWLPENKYTELVTINGDLNDTGKRYIKLFSEKWHTDTIVTTDTTARAQFHGYYGSYTCFPVTHQSKKVSFDAVKKQSREILIKIP